MLMFQVIIALIFNFCCCLYNCHKLQFSNNSKRKSSSKFQKSNNIFFKCIQNLNTHHCTRKTFTYGKKFIKQCVPVGNHIVTSQYPVNSFTYGGIYSPFAAFTLFLALIHQILSHHATSHVILADQK